MVCEWGMSERLGMVNYSEIEEHIFLGREITKTRDHSEYTMVLIDQEVKRILTESYQRAKQLVEKYKDLCEKLAKELLAKEVLTGQEIDLILQPALLQETQK
jgi:cell division protease FtsH